MDVVTEAVRNSGYPGSRFVDAADDPNGKGELVGYAPDCISLGSRTSATGRHRLVTLVVVPREVAFATIRKNQA